MHPLGPLGLLPCLYICLTSSLRVCPASPSLPVVQIFQKEPFFCGQDNADQLVKIADVRDPREYPITLGTTRRAPVFITVLVFFGKLLCV